MFGGNKKLTFDLECFLECKTELEQAVERLTGIQNELEKAMIGLKDVDAWSGRGSDAFYKMYDSTWVEGVKDRKAIMERMCEHLQTAYDEYLTVKEEADKLKIETN